VEIRSRTDRAAAVILAIVGVALLSSAAATFVLELPAILGAEGEYRAGNAKFSVLLTSLPMAVGALIVLASARKLWRSSPRGRALALAFVLFAGPGCALGAAVYGNILLAAKGTFWIPVIVAVGALLVACLLLAGWIASRARVAGSS
jgi:hypothetical protein